MAWLLSWAEVSMTEHLIAASIKGVLVLITAAALCFALRHASAAARHFVWMLALGGLLALPVLSFGLPVWQIALLPPAPVGIRLDYTRIARVRRERFKDCDFTCCAKADECRQRSNGDKRRVEGI